MTKSSNLVMLKWHRRKRAGLNRSRAEQSRAEQSHSLLRVSDRVALGMVEEMRVELQYRAVTSSGTEKTQSGFLPSHQTHNLTPTHIHTHTHTFTASHNSTCHNRLHIKNTLGSRAFTRYYTPDSLCL